MTSKLKTICLFALFPSVLIAAQPDSLRILSVQEIYRQNHWLDGTNPVGLAFNRFQAFSTAEAGYITQKGNFGNASLPESIHRYDIYSESFQELGKVSVYGKLGYHNSRNQDVSWNGMSGDYWHGINLCDSVNGDQKAEQYELAGAFALPAGTRWLIGTQFDYRVKLTAKNTDPRNKNQWMEWELAPGVGYRWSESLWLGASLLYAHRKEEVDYKNIGTHTEYPLLTAYPLSFFKALPRGENANWHYKAEEMGAALQAEIRTEVFRLFQEIGGSLAEQKIISNRIQNRKEGETEAWEASYKGSLQRNTPHRLHEWKWQASLSGGDSYDPIQRQESNNTWILYGKVLRSTTRSDNYSLTYGYQKRRDAWNTRFSLLAGINYSHTRSSLLFYPTEYTQAVHRFLVHSTLTRGLVLKHGHLACALSGAYGKGGGDMMKQKQAEGEENAPDITLWQNPDRLQQDFYLQTGARWNVNASVTYTRTLPLTWFIRLSGGYEKAGKLLLQTNKNYFSAQIGLLF